MADTKRFVNNLFWKFLERCGSQGVSLIVSILLARLIEPSAFGIMSIIYVFTAVFNAFVDSGMGVALIQKKDADDVDFSSVFFFNITLGSTLYLLLFFAAPLIASFYEMPELVSLLRVASLVLIISGLRNVQQAFVSKTLIFKKYFYATLTGVISSAIIALAMAYSGFGIWALVFQNLSNLAISTIVLWIVVKWRPKLLFSFIRLKSLISYGWKLLVTGVLDILYENVRALIIGKMYKPADLAYYNMGAQFPYGIVNNINASIDSVLLPTVSEEQDDRPQVKRMVRRAIVTSTYVMAPLMFCLAAVADNFVYLFLTEKWAECIPYLRIFCISFMFYPINSSNLNVIKALGRSDIILKLEITKKIIGVSIILITMWISPFAMAVGALCGAFICQFLNAWPNKKLLNYSYLEQIRDILPNLIVALFVAGLVFSISLIGIPRIASFCFQIITGLVLYPFISKIIGLESYSYILDVIKMYLNKKNK